MKIGTDWVVFLGVRKRVGRGGLVKNGASWGLFGLKKKNNVARSFWYKMVLLGSLDRLVKIWHLYPPPLYKKQVRATLPSHPQGNVPEVTVPSPAPRYYAKDARHKARQENNKPYEPLNNLKNACLHACLRPVRHMLCVPLFLAGVFDFEELHMLNRDHLNY